MQRSSPFHVIVLLLLASRGLSWKKGVVFGGGEWSADGAGFGTPSAAAALEALASTGADHVRILATEFQNYSNTTSIGPIAGRSPLASSTVVQLRATIRAAHALKLSVFLAPILDQSWDIPTNGRSITPAPGATWTKRQDIGATFTEAQWREWFASYTKYILPLARLAHDEQIAMFEVCSELDTALSTRGAQWRVLIAEVRAVYGGAIHVAATTDALAKMTFIDALDALGVDAYYGLGETLQLGAVPTVDSLVAAWAPTAMLLNALSTKWKKPILFTEVGYQSRPSCHVRPWGTLVHDPMDDSAWLEDHDMACQANAYEALFRVFAHEPWWDGVFWWLWRADATAGGTGDSDFTPHGKPAEAVLRRWYGAESSAACMGGDGLYSVERFMESGSGMATPWPALAADGSDAACDGSDAVVAALRASMPATASRLNGTRRAYNGYVFGGPDEWSSPSYRYDSKGAFASLGQMHRAGADTAEIIVQWYFANISSTAIYAITEPSSPLRTSTDAELHAVLAEAKRLGMRTMLTLMLDPDWTLPDQSWCRGNPTTAPGGKHKGCGWRGQLGEAWDPSECSAGSSWGEWFAGYTPAVLKYAALAERAGVDAYLLSHELIHAVNACPAQWTTQLAAVRKVYSGEVSHAFNPDMPSPFAGPVLPAKLTSQRWVQDLDWIGVDCYMQVPLPPYTGSSPPPLSPNDTHPALPWQDLTETELLAAYATLVPLFAQLSRATGDKQIVCTEIGWASRPWTYTGRAGMGRLDAEDCSVWDQCVSTKAQAMTYTAFLQTYYAQPWFGGVTFWTWRADPTVGGLSDDGFSPQGKAAANVTRDFWGAP